MKQGDDPVTLGAEAKPCPWCGHQPEAQWWHGGGPFKHMVYCINERRRVAPGVTGETLGYAIRYWNTRKSAEAER